MDAFFASVEQLDHPEWRGLPVIVGGEERGVVTAASYEARRFGVHSAMPVGQAKKRCPHGIYARVRMDRYKALSGMVMGVLHEFSPLVEKASIDEAYLDATGMEKLFGPPEAMGRALKDAVYSSTGLRCSVGFAPVKFLAKIASDLRKPDGLSIIREEEMLSFLANMPVRRIPGVGKKFMAALERIGVETCRDVLRYSEEFWKRQHGKAGEALWQKAQGIDSSVVEPYSDPKSESAENTFAKPTSDKELLKNWLLKQAERVGTNLRKAGIKGRTITVKVKYSDFQQITRSRSFKAPTANTELIFSMACELLDELELRQSVRLIGVGMSNYDKQEYVPEPRQLSLFGESEEAEQKRQADRVATEKERKLDEAMDSLREKFGHKAIVRGRLFDFDS